MSSLQDDDVPRLSTLVRKIAVCSFRFRLQSLRETELETVVPVLRGVPASLLGRLGNLKSRCLPSHDFPNDWHAGTDLHTRADQDKHGGKINGALLVDIRVGMDFGDGMGCVPIPVDVPLVPDGAFNGRTSA